MDENDTTGRTIKVRTVRSDRTKGYALLRYSPRPLLISECSTVGKVRAMMEDK